MELSEALCQAASEHKRYWPFLDVHVKLWWLKEHLPTITKMPLGYGPNRMLRIGLGKNEGRWFFRIDLWFAGFRIAAK